VSCRPANLAEGGFMDSGTVKFYDGEKRFGMITPDDGGEEVFVHATALRGAGIFELEKGQRVAYEMQQDSFTGRFAASTLQVSEGGGGVSDRAGQSNASDALGSPCLPRPLDDNCQE
jgi:cold shock protein